MFSRTTIQTRPPSKHLKASVNVPSSPIKVCCLAYDAYPAIEPGAAGLFGGTETRAWDFARGLATQPDVQVSFVVRRREPLLRDEYAGVQILRRVDRLYHHRFAVAQQLELKRGWPPIRVRRWSPQLLWQVPLLAAVELPRRRHRHTPRPDRFLRAVSADVFCCFGVGKNSADAIATAQATGRASVLMLGSDGDLDPRFTATSQHKTMFRESGRVCYYALTHADAIVAQTVQQQDWLRDRFGRSSTVIANPIDLAAWDTGIRTAPPLPELAGLTNYALWIGRADADSKRPLLCVEIARRCPETPFVLILNPRDAEVERQVRATAPPNVHIVSRVPFAQMPAVFRAAAVFVNTSAFEGFPNVFLQACASGVPIASVEVGSDFLDKAGCGHCAAGDPNQLADFICRLTGKPDFRKQLGDAGRRYVTQHHALPARAAELAHRLRNTLHARAGEPPA